jgi:hypothetical protein
MKRSIAWFAVPVAVLAVTMLPAASAPESRFPADAGTTVAMMGPDDVLEMSFGKDGSIDDVEFHVPYDRLPAPVREALDKLLPGDALGAEIEHTAQGVLYEVTKKGEGGAETEILVDASGKVVNWEVVVDAAKVPEAVKKAADGATGGTATQYEEIRDGARALTAYHVKKDESGIKWKIAISPAGAVQSVRREVKAEIEVTVR